MKPLLAAITGIGLFGLFTLPCLRVIIYPFLSVTDYLPLPACV